MAKMAADGYVEMDKREYLRIGLEVFGTDDVRQWRFRCPACGLETEGWLFEAAGAKPDELYANCFARFDRDSMSGAFDPAEQGCGWSAYEGDEEVAGAWIIDGVDRPARAGQRRRKGRSGGPGEYMGIRDGECRGRKLRWQGRWR